MQRRTVVLLNAAAGLDPGEAGREVARVRDLFGREGVGADVRDVRGPEILAAAREAVAGEAELVVVGGGDGTVSAAAGALAGTSKRLGILPLGTFNHFAKDLGLPLDLEGAIHTVARGRVRAVDVGQANDRVFVNNSSIGLYPRAVAGREALRVRGGSHRWVAAARAAWRTFADPPVLRVTLRTADGAVTLATPLVFVGNNRYELTAPGRGRRDDLEGGDLWLYVARHAGRRGLVRLGLRALFGRVDGSRDLQGFGLPEFVVEDRRRTLEVAFDGEVCVVSPPLHYRVRPRALEVMVP